MGRPAQADDESATEQTANDVSFAVVDLFALYHPAVPAAIGRLDYPPGMRAAAVVQAALLAVIALVVLSRSGLVLERWSRISRWAIWLVVAFSALSVLLNVITPSSGERAVWVPVAVLLLASSLTVAIAARRDPTE